MNCIHCNKDFGTKYLLKQHQTKSKFCLKIQGKTETNFKCAYCDKFLSTAQNKKNHEEICKTYLSKQEYDLRVEHTKKNLHSISKTIKLLKLTDEELLSFIQNIIYDRLVKNS